MKAKKPLFLTSGILKIVVCAISFLIFFLISLMIEPIIESICGTPEAYQEMLNQLADVSPAEYAYWQSKDLAEFQAYLMNTVNALCGVALFTSVTGIMFGIFNIIFAKKYNTKLAGKTGKKVTFMVFELILYPGLITNVLSIIALWLKDDKVENVTPEPAVQKTNESEVQE